MSAQTQLILYFVGLFIAGVGFVRVYRLAKGNRRGF
jgi:hypothetical protein